MYWGVGTVLKIRIRKNKNKNSKLVIRGSAFLGRRSMTPFFQVINSSIKSMDKLFLLLHLSLIFLKTFISCGSQFYFGSFIILTKRIKYSFAFLLRKKVVVREYRYKLYRQ